MLLQTLQVHVQSHFSQHQHQFSNEDDKSGRKTIIAFSTFFDLAYQFKRTTYGGTHS